MWPGGESGPRSLECGRRATWSPLRSQEKNEKCDAKKAVAALGGEECGGERCSFSTLLGAPANLFHRLYMEVNRMGTAGEIGGSGGAICSLITTGSPSQNASRKTTNGHLILMLHPAAWTCTGGSFGCLEIYSEFGQVLRTKIGMNQY